MNNAPCEYESNRGREEGNLFGCLSMMRLIDFQLSFLWETWKTEAVEWIGRKKLERSLDQHLVVRCRSCVVSHLMKKPSRHSSATLCHRIHERHVITLIYGFRASNLFRLQTRYSFNTRFLFKFLSPYLLALITLSVHQRIKKALLRRVEMFCCCLTTGHIAEHHKLWGNSDNCSRVHPSIAHVDVQFN